MPVRGRSSLIVLAALVALALVGVGVGVLARRSATPVETAAPTTPPPKYVIRISEPGDLLLSPEDLGPEWTVADGAAGESIGADLAYCPINRPPVTAVETALSALPVYSRVLDHGSERVVQKLSTWSSPDVAAALVGQWRQWFAACPEVQHPDGSRSGFDVIDRGVLGANSLLVRWTTGARVRYLLLASVDLQTLEIEFRTGEDVVLGAVARLRARATP